MTDHFTQQYRRQNLITGPASELFEVVAVCDGPSHGTILNYKDGYIPTDRIVFIGTPAEMHAGTWETAHAKDVDFLAGKQFANLTSSVNVSDNDLICILREEKAIPPASYSHHLRKCAEIADEREPQYGTALSNLMDTQDIAYAMFGLKLNPVQLAQVMIAFKTSRQKNRHKPDNILDSINYHAMMLEAIEAQEKSTLANSPHTDEQAHN